MISTILILVPGNERGGAATHLVTFANALRESDRLDSFHFLCVGEGPLQAQLERVDGARVTCVSAQLSMAQRALREWVRGKESSVLVHAHGPRMNLLARWAIGRRIPWTTTLHSNIFNDYLGSRWKSVILPRVNRFALQASVGVFVVNPLFGRFLPRKPAFLVPNSVSITPLLEPKLHYERTLREGLGIPIEAPVFGLAARFDPVKDIPTFINAIPLLRHEGVHVVLAGDGAQRGVIQQQVDSLGLRHRVHLLGFLDDVRPFYAGLTAHVLPSTSEGLPSTLLEAGWFDVPNIGSAIPGIEQLIRNGDTGLTFNVGDPTDLARQMNALLDREDLGAAYAQRMKQDVLPNYTPESLVKAYMDGYAQLLPDQWIENNTV